MCLKLNVQQVEVIVENVDTPFLRLHGGLNFLPGLCISQLLHTTMTKWISKVLPILISFVPRQLLGKKEDSFLRLENVKRYVSNIFPFLLNRKHNLGQILQMRYF